ncbi:MAG TPA: glycosyltransferase [Burkholderiales bacterium]|nr:glycosyltransferase [Burkholderiales bacterium]
MKVLGFDAWTKGAIHYQRLVAPLKARGVDLTLLHLGSWGDEPGRAPSEFIDDLPVRDISYYAGLSLPQILDREHPSAVVFTSTESFACRAFNRYCRQRNIPTVHVFHGLQRVLVLDGSAPFDSRLHTRLWLMRRMIVKGMLHFWPAYTRALWQTGAGADEWRRFYYDLTNRVRGTRPSKAASDSRADRACVFNDAEIGYVADAFGYRPEHVVSVGNPDLVLFGLSTENAGLLLRPDVARGTHVMYVDASLLNYGGVYGSEAEFVGHITRTRDELARQGKQLVFKPHPSQIGSRVLSALAAVGIEICERDRFVPTLERCCATITEPSSAAMLPALMGMPLLLARYGNLAGQVFGEFFTSYPRSRYLTDINHFSETLVAEADGLDRAATMQWIRRNTGPLPAEDMPARVADVLVSLIR